MIGKIYRSCLTTSSQISQILVQRGLAPEVCENVALALQQTVPSPSDQLNYAKNFPIPALKQLENSWRTQNVSNAQNNVNVLVIDPTGREFSVSGREGESLMDLSKKRHTELSEFLECACQGNMTCSTCHVYVLEPKEVGTLASEEEQDMIDLAWEPIIGQSRLGCQLTLQSGVQLKIRIPKHATNYFK